MAKVLEKTITNTTSYVNSSLAIDPSTAIVSDGYPLDEIEIDSSVPERKKWERPYTHIQIDYDELDVIFPKDTSRNINDILIDELKEQLDSSNPYSKYYERINNAVYNFYNGGISKFN